MFESLARAYSNAQNNDDGAKRFTSRLNYMNMAQTPSVLYRSTRGQERHVTFEEAVLRGVPRDQGLFIPEEFPKISAQDLKKWRKMSFAELAFEFLSMLIHADQIPSADLRDICNRSFENFRHIEIAPATKLKDTWILELFHGPSLSYHDLGAQFLGYVLQFFASRKRFRSSVTVVEAGSGGGGEVGAAIGEGMRDRKGIDTFVLFPFKKLPSMHERQLTSIQDPRVHPLCIRGDHQDTQQILNNALADERYSEEARLCRAGGTNIASIWMYMVCHVYAYFRVGDAQYAYKQAQSKQKKKTSDSKSEKPVKDTKAEPFSVTLVIPMKDMEDVDLFMTALYLKDMGLPVKDIVLCLMENENQGILEFFTNGVLSAQTISFSPNLERYLFILAERDPEKVNSWMDILQLTRMLSLPPELLPLPPSPISPSPTAVSPASPNSMNRKEGVKIFRGEWDEVKEEITRVYIEEKGAEWALLSPHSALASLTARCMQLAPASTIILGTTHWGKYEKGGLGMGVGLGDGLGRGVRDLISALPDSLGLPPTPTLPFILQDLAHKPTRVTFLPTSTRAVQDFINASIEKSSGTSVVREEKRRTLYWLVGGVALVGVVAMVWTRYRKK